MQTSDSTVFLQNLDTKAFKALFKTKPYLHAWAILSNWFIIILTIALSVYVAPFWLYPLAVLIIGAKMHALAILAHDAAHFRFLKNRKWNDLITNYLVMYPIFTSLEKYRNNHLKHHQHLNTEDDPDWVAKLGNRDFTFPKTKRAFLLTVFSYFFLIKGISDAFWFLKRFENEDSTAVNQTESKIFRLVFYALMFGGLIYFGAWKYFLLYWIVPYFSTFFMIQYIRSVAEHFGDLAYEDDLTGTRTVKATLLEKFFLAPHNVGYHLEHHLYPGVPFYNLPKLHELLMGQEAYRGRAHLTIGYAKGLLGELS